MSLAPKTVPGTSRCSTSVHWGHECLLCMQQVFDKRLLESWMAVNRGEVLGMAQVPEEEAGHPETDINGDRSDIFEGECWV